MKAARGRFLISVYLLQFSSLTRINESVYTVNFLEWSILLLYNIPSCEYGQAAPDAAAMRAPDCSKLLKNQFSNFLEESYHGKAKV